MEQIEIWKDIPNYDGKYQVSNKGRVKSLKRWSGTKFYDREYILNNYINKRNGYVYVYLTKNNKSKNVRLHRLVAQSFVDNPNNYNQINHKDGNKKNNNVENLEWCSGSYNIKDMYKRRGKYSKDGKIIEKYKELKSCNEVAKVFNTTSENIRQVLIRNDIKRYNLCGRKKSKGVELMTDKELIRELEISKLQEENAELKSQLRGTTHCFDEEEHNKLKEEITNLSKDVDMWNAKYNEVFDENKELKSQLEEYQLQNVDLRADIMIQKQAFPNKLIKDKSFYDLYDMPTYEDLLTQQIEFINYLENEIKLYKNDIQNFSKDYKAYFLLINDLKVSKSKIEEILNKYKEIIGGNK